MRKEITINGKAYEAKAITFNALCDMDELGVSIDDVSNGKKLLQAVRAYAALCMGTGVELAGEAIGEHIKKGEGFNDLIECMMEAFEEGGFFQPQQTTTETAQSEDAEAENQKSKKK